MKKITILITLVFLFVSCSNNITSKENKKNYVNSKEKIDKVFGGEFEKVEKEDLKNDIEKINNNNGEELIYKEIKDYNKIKLSDINEEYILKNSLDKYELIIDLGFSNKIDKLIKILKIVKDISDKNTINSFNLICNDLNFSKNEIGILKNTKIKLLLLDSSCGFRKEKFNKNWYDEEKVISFLKNTKYIKEIHIGHIDEDYFRKKDGIIEKSDRIYENSKWEKIEK